MVTGPGIQRSFVFSYRGFEDDGRHESCGVAGRGGGKRN